MLNNEHVYKYYRWLGFLADKNGAPWSSFHWYTQAELERRAQGGS